MTSYPTTQVQDEFLKAIRKSQETVPAAQLPLADKLPKPEEVVASAYDFAEKLLATQRQFAEELLKVTNPLMPSDGKSAQKEKAAAAK
jgi:hypothetical protein